MEIDNGENIIGYEFLHGTNAEYGGFQIEGRITCNNKGTYTFSFNYTWNDYMNAEEKYTTDQIKAVLGKIISFNRARNYVLRIIWSDTSKLNYRGVWTSGWLS